MQTSKRLFPATNLAFVFITLATALTTFASHSVEAHAFIFADGGACTLIDAITVSTPTEN